MEKDLEQWPEIALLIERDKKNALDDFHRLEFVTAARPGLLAPPAPGRWPGLRPAFVALAASLLLAAGLVSFWALKESWGSSTAVPAGGALLSGSFLYGGAGSRDAGMPAAAAAHAVNPYFSAWAEAALQRPVAAMVHDEPAAAIDLSTPVERGDPEEVRRKMSRVIRENTLEHLLTQIQEIHNKEA